MSWLYVAVGSALGGISRYAVGLWFARVGSTFPWGTFAVNALGSFLIGICAASLMNATRSESVLREFAMVGFLGGFTTFSAFSLQTFQLLRDGKLMLAGTNVLASVLVCVIGCWIGFVLGVKFASS